MTLLGSPRSSYPISSNRVVIADLCNTPSSLGPTSLEGTMIYYCLFP